MADESRWQLVDLERLVGNGKELARQYANQLANEGASAIVLTGSYASGRAQPESDLDILAIGKGESGLRVVDGYLLSISWHTADHVRKQFRRPAAVGMDIPGWRHAILLHDPDGIAAALKQEALDWSWALIERECNASIAENLSGLVEEVAKLALALRTGQWWMAAVQRSILALRLPGILAVHRRLLYETENVMWDMVAETEGARWRRLQSAAFCESGEGIERSAEAALGMYSYVAGVTSSLLNPGQAEVVGYALRLISQMAHPANS